MNKLREFDRAEAERLSRMRDCFEVDRPARAEVLHAISRWNHSKSRAVPSVPLRTAWVVAIAMMVSGGAMAASGVVKLPSFMSFAARLTATKPAAKPSLLRSTAYVLERGGRRVEFRQPTEFTLLPGEQAALVVDETRTELVGPGLAHIQAASNATGWVTQFEPQGWAPELAKRETMPVGSGNISPSQSTHEPPEENTAVKRQATVNPSSTALVTKPDGVKSTTAAPEVSGQLEGAWARAAAAMRQGDDAAASAALAEISHSNEPAARDAALLTQAQLDLAAGRRARAIPVLTRLAQTGSTGFVRQRASEIIASGK